MLARHMHGGDHGICETQRFSQIIVGGGHGHAPPVKQMVHPFQSLAD